MDKLQGYKTYVVAALFAVATFLMEIHVISADVFKTIEGFLLALGLAALRAGVTKSAPPPA